MTAGYVRPTVAAVTGTLVLVRHGESVWVAEGRFQGRRDPQLSPLGVRQAELVADRLADRSAGRAHTLPIPDGPAIGIWHSPLARAASTAQLIAARHPGAPPLYPTDGLTEIAQGEWEGLLHAEVSARWPDELARWRRTPTRANAPGGEPLLAAAERVGSALRAITADLAEPGDGSTSAPDDVAADADRRRSPVSGYPTGGDARDTNPWAVLVAHDGVFRLALMTMLGVPLERFWSFPFSLCGITAVALQDGVATLRAHNVSDHLAPLSGDERAAAEASGDRRGAL